MLTAQPTHQISTDLPAPPRDESEVVSRQRDLDPLVDHNLAAKHSPPKRRPPPIHTQKPPFTYHPEYIPAKGILKPAPPLPQRTSWFTSLNTRLGNAISNAYPVVPVVVPPVPEKKAPLVDQAPAAGVRTSVGSFSTFKKIMNTQVRPTPPPVRLPQELDSEDILTTPLDSPLLPEPIVGDDAYQNGAQPPSPTQLLHPSTLKRVRFSVGKLTTEYYPYAAIVTVDQDLAEAGGGKPELVPVDGANGLIDEGEAVARKERENEGEASPAGSLEVVIGQDLVTTGNGEVGEAEEVKKIYSAREVLQYYLTACKNREEFPMERLVDIMRSYQGSQLLEVIDLSNDPIDRKIAEPLADVMTLECGLQRLILENCGLEDDTLKALLHGLLVTDTLPYLSLANNKKIKTNGFKYIAVYIKKSASLKHLNLANTLPDKKSAQYLSHSITPSITTQHRASLETLILDSCQLKTPLLELLAPGIRRSGLRVLSLRNNKINHLGALWIGVILRDYEDQEPAPGAVRPPPTGPQEEDKAGRTWNDGLQVLDLRSNEVRTGMQYVAQSLRRNRSLKELRMADCKIDGKGCIAIGDALKYNQNLERVDLSRNQLCMPNVDGVNAIKTALFVNRSLKELVLADTGLTSEAAIALAECLPENKALIRLDLSSNAGIDIAGIMALSVSIKMNFTLTYLDVNVPPNDVELARLSREIVSTCTRNTEGSFHSERRSFAHSVNGVDTPTTSPTRHATTMSPQTSSSTIDLDARVNASPPPDATTTSASASITQPIARLSLQERLAVATKGAKSTPQAFAPASRTEETRETRGALGVRGELALARESVTLLREVMEAENARRAGEVGKERPGEVVAELYVQCQRCQGPLLATIPTISDEQLLEDLLAVNDELTSLLQVYEEMYDITAAPDTTLIVQPPSPPLQDEVSNAPSVSLAPEGQPPTLPVPDAHITPAFSIGDDEDEDDDDNLPLRRPTPNPAIVVSTKKAPPPPLLTISSSHDDDLEYYPKSPLEELRREKEEEEGEILRKAKEVVVQELMSVDDEGDEEEGDFFVDAEDDAEDATDISAVALGVDEASSRARQLGGASSPSLEASGEELKTMILDPSNDSASSSRRPSVQA